MSDEFEMPSLEEQKRSILSFRQVLIDMGQDDLAQEVDAFIEYAESPEMDAEQLERRANAIFAAVMNLMPGDFKAVLDADLDSEASEFLGPFLAQVPPDIFKQITMAPRDGDVVIWVVDVLHKHGLLANRPETIRKEVADAIAYEKAKAQGLIP